MSDISCNTSIQQEVDVTPAVYSPPDLVESVCVCVYQRDIPALNVVLTHLRLKQ